MMHNYTKVNGNQTIETPPEDYTPNKIGDISMEKLQQDREQAFQ